MNPMLLDLGFVQIRYYGILLALSFLAGYFLILRLGKEKKLEEKDLQDYFIYLLIFMIIGARLFHCLFYEPSYYFNNLLEILFVWKGGLASHGALIAAVLVTIIFSRKRKINFYDLADITVIPVALGACLVRIGNFINGELGGKIINNFKHPVQLYQAFTNLVLFFVLYFSRNIRRKGSLFWGFIFLYSLFSFITEFYKDLPFAYGLTLAQFISVPLFALSLIWFIKK